MRILVLAALVVAVLKPGFFDGMMWLFWIIVIIGFLEEIDKE